MTVPSNTVGIDDPRQPNEKESHRAKEETPIHERSDGGLLAPGASLSCSSRSSLQLNLDQDSLTRTNLPYGTHVPAVS